MIRVFIDLEMNMVDQANTELRKRLPHEIIEIGAVKMDEQFRVVDRFCSYVRPRYNEAVHWSVRKLTGITAKLLSKQAYLEEVLPRFTAWLGTEQSVLLYAWSDSDRAQLERECTYKQLWTPQLREACVHWTDFQKVFSGLIGYRNGMALSRAVECMGLDFDGTRHDALSDAENCARLMALTQDRDAFEARKAFIPPEPVPPKRPRSSEKQSADAAVTDAAPDGTTQDDETPEKQDTAQRKRRRRPNRHRSRHKKQGTVQNTADGTAERPTLRKAAVSAEKDPAAE